MPPTKEERLKQIENSFTYHPPRGNQQQRYESLRAKAKELALLIEEVVPDGRYKALAITHLEISGMCANKGIACDDPA